MELMYDDDDCAAEPVSPKSLPDFQSIFPNEEACCTYLNTMRFPNGFVCPHCNWRDQPYRFQNQPDMQRCRNCKRNTRLTGGTIMQKSKVPLNIWFWGAFLVTSLTPGMSALQFQKMLGIKRYETAFNMLHKLRAAMVRPGRDPIGGEWPVEVDETFVGGATQGEGLDSIIRLLWEASSKFARERWPLGLTRICLPASVHSTEEDTAVALSQVGCVSK